MAKFRLKFGSKKKPAYVVFFRKRVGPTERWAGMRYDGLVSNYDPVRATWDLRQELDDDFWRAPLQGSEAPFRIDVNKYRCRPRAKAVIWEVKRGRLAPPA